MTRVVDKSIVIYLPSYDPLDGLMHPVSRETMERIAVPLTSMMADLIAYADGKLTPKQLDEALAAFQLGVLELQESCTGCDGQGCPACNGRGWTWRQA